MTPDRGRWLAALAMSVFGAFGSGAVAQSGGFAAMMTDAMVRMDRDMMRSMNGAPDHDFAAMMIPHHQGAIAMAKSELKYGQDPVLRQLAKDIIEAQKSEIALMQRWLKQNASAKK